MLDRLVRNGDQMSEKKSATFEQFGKDFQEKIVQALIFDKDWAQQMVELMDSNYFEQQYLRYLTEKYFDYHKKYREFPTLQLLAAIAKDDYTTSNGANGPLFEIVVSYLMRIDDNPNSCDLKFVKDRVFDFCRRQAFKVALEDSVDLVLTEKYEAVVDRMKKAIATGVPSSVGHDFIEDVALRYGSAKRNTVPTGFDEFDERSVLNGGLGRGEIASIISPVGCGKSHFLVAVGANAIRKGYNVAHYTCELSETQIGIRYDSNICEISSTDACDNVEKIQQKIATMKDAGRVFIKEYPTGMLTANVIRAHLEKLEMAKKFVPDLVIVDYADIIRSSQRHEALRMELKCVYEELRALAKELKVGVWTACFHGDTEIASPAGNFKIKDAVGKSGFPVYSYNHTTRRLELKTVKSVYKSGENVEVWKVTLDNGKEVVVTPNHKFMKRDGTYCEVRNLNIGDSLMPYEERVDVESINCERRIHKIEYYGFADVYNMEVDELHNYALTAGIVVKNSQSNREGINSDVIDMTNMSESLGKAMVADFIISFSQRMAEKASNIGRFYIAKNRAGRDGLAFRAEVDKSMSIFKIMGRYASIDEIAEENNSDLHEEVKQRWKEFENDKHLKLTTNFPQ